MSQFTGRRELGQRIIQTIDSSRDEIISIAKEILSNPEPLFQERRAHELLTSYLAGKRFEVTTEVAGIPTTFHARMDHWNDEQMRKGLRHGHVAFLADYHAGTDEGHVYGRHLGTGAALAATIGLAASFHRMFGTVSLYGAPGTGPNGAMVAMAERDIFDEPDCVIGARPESTGLGFQSTIATTDDSYAQQSLFISYPEGPDDALDQLERAIQAVIGEQDEGVAVTRFDQGFIVQAPLSKTVEELAKRIQALASARASSSGVPVEIRPDALLPDMQVSRILARRMKTFGDSIGLRQDRIHKMQRADASGLGNISHRVATVQARFPVSTEDVRAGTEEFRLACDTDEAYEQMITMAKAMALAGLDVLGDMEFRGFVEGELIRGLKQRGITREPRRWLGVHPIMPRKEPKEQPDLPEFIVRGPGIPPPKLDDES
ncbi:MAG: hypothetical protein ACOC9Y_05970 [Chloroflexota bacterium]